MEIYQKGNRIIEFKEEGVIFILPEALDKVYVGRESITIKPVDGYPDRRDVIQVSLVEIANPPVKKDLLNTDLTLLVYYNREDEARAIKNREKEALAKEVPTEEKYTDKPCVLLHDGNKWHRSKDDQVTYGPGPGEPWVGSMMIKMDKNKWDDPLIGVGP